MALSFTRDFVDCQRLGKMGASYDETADVLHVATNKHTGEVCVIAECWGQYRILGEQSIKRALAECDRWVNDEHTPFERAQGYARVAQGIRALGCGAAPVELTQAERVALVGGVK